MKTKSVWVALLASAALIAQAQGGGHSSGGGGGSGGHFGGGGGGHFTSGGSGSGRGGYGSSFRGMPGRNFARGPMITSGRMSSVRGVRSPSFDRTGDANHTTRSVNGRNQSVASLRHNQNGAGQVRHGTQLPGTWRNHVFGQRSAGWHRDWNRGRDHWWNGHHCRFINGSWVIFDTGFYPWWPYWYPYDYDYPYGYPYSYSDDDADYSDQAPETSDVGGAPVVAAAQERLFRLGYYHGEIDGVFGIQTRRALTRYQSRHHLGASGDLTPATLEALGLQRLASD